MSFQIRNIREIPGDNLAKFANELSKKLSRFLTKDQLELLDDREDIYTDGQDFDVAVKLHDELISTKTFTAIEYFPPNEPDSNKLKLWLTGTNMGNDIPDRSGFDMASSLDGNPLLIDGAPFDLGIHTGGVKSLALRFNRPGTDSENQDFISIAHSNEIQLIGISTGVSYFMRVRIHSFAQQNGVDRCLFEKADDATPLNGAVAKITTDGRIQFQVVRAGNTFVKQTPTSTLTTNTVYDIWFVYNVSGDVIKIYVNNVDQTLTTPSAIAWNGSTVDMGMRIMKRGPAQTDNGLLYGDLYDFRMYKEKVVSATEVGRMWVNKWSISDIPYGQVMISNYWSAYGVAPPAIASFTSTSFTGTSFDV